MGDLKIKTNENFNNHKNAYSSNLAVDALCVREGRSCLASKRHEYNLDETDQPI